MDGAELVETFPSMFTPDDMPLPWMDSPFLETLLDKSDLSNNERDLVRGFARDGFMMIDPEIPSEVLDRVDADIRGRHPLDGEGRPQRIQDAWRFSDAVKEIATADTVLRTLRVLYRRDPIPFQTLSFGVGTEQRTHSDTIHFQTYPPNWMCGVWVALEDIDEENGPLHYYAGSHRERVYDLADLDLESDYGAYASYEDFVEALADAKGWQRRTLTIRRGQALIWAANLLHGGEPVMNRERSRRTQVTHYYFGGCTYYTPMRSDVFLGRIAFRDNLVDIRNGQPIPHWYKGHRYEPTPSDRRAVLPARLAGNSETLRWERASTWHRWVPPAAVPVVRRAARRLRSVRGK